jgi:NAD(P)-dependent dehydrogenase (short-subunit alcohol dehydrogenase family)
VDALLVSELEGRRALVTGAGQGVGRAIALSLGADGHEVVVNDLVAERAEAVATEVRAAGGSARSAAFDVTDHAAVVAAVDEAGGVDVLVNNAGNAGVQGWGERGWFHESEPADWEPFLRVNLYGAMHCARAVLPHMVDSGWGRIVTVISDAGRTGDAQGAAYSAAKAGAAGLTRALALEVGRHGITANNVSLGTMRTEATEAVWAEPDSPMAKSILQRYVVRRPGLPEEAAALVAFLAGDQAAWITGQTYPVNGGYSFSL